MKKSLRIILAAVAVYLALLILLLAVESGAPNATIHSFGDAIWYSLITMTTVGYGDLSPVTHAGRFLGLIFALCSIGILTALIGIGLNLIGGQFIPALRLRLGRRRSWYVFHDENEDSAVLARELRRTDKGCLLLFPAGETNRMSGADVVRMDTDPVKLRRLRGGQPEGCSLFFLGDDPWVNYSEGKNAVGQGFPVYCMTDVRADDTPPQLRLFSRTEALSRCYWKEHPLTGGEQCVVLIGCGRAGSAILERAVLTNVFPPERRIEYHVFGDTAGFAALHPQLVKAMAPGSPHEDTICFHPESWTLSPGLIGRADRIILCFDQDEENLAARENLLTWFSTTAQIHLRLDTALPSVCSFGEREDVITAEFVMKDAINRQAVTVNNIYNESSEHPVAWEELNWFVRQSNIAAADHLIVKIRYLLEDDSITEVTEDVCRRAYNRYREIAGEKADLLQEIEHRRWMRFHWLYNWDHGAERNNSLRRHPMIVPYEDLSLEEQRKDAYAWELLGRLASRP